MLSPFPGMDPYLERPAKWHSVHTRLINAISDQLADTLSPDFYVEIEERVVLTLSENPDVKYQIEPDVYVVRGGESLNTGGEYTDGWHTPDTNANNCGGALRSRSAPTLPGNS